MEYIETDENSLTQPDDNLTPKERNGQWQHFVDHCFDQIDKIKDSEYRALKLANIEAAHRVYRQIEPSENKHWKGESKVVLPLLTITVDNIEPRLVAGLVGKQPYVQFEMDGMTEKDETTLIIEDFFNQELKHTVNVERVASTIVHKALLEGTVFLTCRYDEDEITRRDLKFEMAPVIDPKTGMPAIDPQTGQPAMEERVLINPETGEAETEEVVDHVFRGGRVDFINFSDMFIADEADDWEKSDVYRVVRMTYGDLMLKEGKPGYMNLGPWLLDEVKKEDEGDHFDPETASPDQVVEKAKQIANETIELMECCVSYVFQEEDQEEKDVTDWNPTRYVALITKESKVLVRMVPLLDLNYRNEHLIKRVRLNTEAGKAYGTSAYEKLKAIQHGCTDIFNTSVNIANLVLRPWFFYTDAAGFPGEVKLALGKGIKCDDPSQIKFPELRQNPRSFMPFIEMFMGMWQKEGAIGDIQTGQIAAKNRDVTASETMAAIQEGNIKHNYQVLTLKDDFNAVLRTLYDLYYQKMPFDAQFIYRGKIIKIPRSQMRRSYKFKLTGSTDLSNKIIDMQKAEGMYRSIRQDPLANGMELIKRFVQSHDPDANPEAYINPQLNQVLQIMQQFPEVMQMVMQYPQQMQNQQVQMQQQMAQQELQLNEAKAKQDMEIKQQKANLDLQIKQQKAKQDQQMRLEEQIRQAHERQLQKAEAEMEGAETTRPYTRLNG